MRSDAVDHYHWMTNAQFLNAVALGQITPGPVVQTVAVVGYAAAGLGGGLLAAAIAFGPSFAFVLIGGPRFDRLRANAAVQAFLDGAGPAAIGAIAGSAVVLAAEIAPSVAGRRTRRRGDLDSGAATQRGPGAGRGRDHRRDRRASGLPTA